VNKTKFGVAVLSTMILLVMVLWSSFPTFEAPTFKALIFEAFVVDRGSISPTYDLANDTQIWRSFNRF